MTIHALGPFRLDTHSDLLFRGAAPLALGPRAIAFVHLRPKYFGEIIANLLFWLGPDKLLFGSGYAIWSRAIPSRQAASGRARPDWTGDLSRGRTIPLMCLPA